MIDAHIHLDDARFDNDRAKLMQQAVNSGIKQFITPAVSVSGFKKLRDLSTRYSRIIPSYGLHPYFINQHRKSDIRVLDEWLTHNKSYAVGECGLDFYLKDLDKDRQNFFLDAQIDLAKKHSLPLILHARGAINSVFNALKNANYFKAMIHS